MKSRWRNKVYFGDNLPVLENLSSNSVNLIYIDPPFNTGKTQSRTQISIVPDSKGDRNGFRGKRYTTTILGTKAFADQFNDYIAFLKPRMTEAHRILSRKGSLYLHVNYREVHYCKILLDEIFGPENFINEIIWAYDYGGRSKKRWPAKHDNILFYAKDSEQYTFNVEEIERIPYMAPALVGEEKAARGKLPTDTWWHTIVSPTGKEKTGYPTQKPLGILRRIITASSNPGELVLDFFAGSGTTGIAALESDRRFLLVDSNEEAIDVMKDRFKGKGVEFIVSSPPPRSPNDH
jgi:site-specific DNA-methyltransferase (adenine-specific)